MGFLGDLGSVISNQFHLGENTNHTLDSIDIDTGKNIKYGSLGKFATHFDQSSERRYVEEGYLRIDPFTTSPKQFEVLMQEPNATVFIKKRMFSSVGDNFRTDFMNEDEKVYYRAMRILFQNKCAQIATLEKLSKIQKITDAAGNVSEQLMPIIFALSDSMSSGFSQPFGGSSNPAQKEASSFTKIVDNLRRVYGFTRTNEVTSWIADSTNIFQSQFGQGTGTIEITNFTNLTTSTSTNMSSPGTCSITISDPYEAMLITEWDIEKALSDATNMFYNSKISQFAKESSKTLVNDLIGRINRSRALRNASPLSIKVAPDTLLGKRVTVIIDRLGIELPFDYDSSSLASIFSGGAFGGGATVPPEYLLGGAIAGNDGLSDKKIKITDQFGPSNVKRAFPDTEVSLFNRLISTIYSKLSQDSNSQGAFQLHNEKTNYARRKLRFNFSGKLIIQPMDVVHIYMGSKSRFDTKLLSGLQNMFTGVGMLQNANNTIAGFRNAVNTLFNPSASVPLQMEKAAFVGSDFPNYLWSMVRGQFVSEMEGTHVFGGVIQSAVDNWSDGKFTVNVTGTDNTVYFEQGKINFKPGVDIFNGNIYDPLTPFKSNFDDVTSTASGDVPVLLQENQFLLGSSGSGRSGIIKAKLGRYAGTLVDESAIVNDRNVDPVTGRITKVFYAPDGLVYKWKEGIGIFTQFGSNLSMNDANRVGNPNIANEPFAGQDVMNVLSLLITGVPYNFATYYKATQNIDGAMSDPISKENAAHSFSLSLRNDLVKRNTLWGNFVPFKNLVLDEASYSKMLQSQATIIGQNVELDKALQELKDLNNQAIMAGAININAPSAFKGIESSKFNTIQQRSKILSQRISDITKEIDKQNVAYKNHAKDPEASFDSTDFLEANNKTKEISDSVRRRMLRRQLNFLTRRMSYNVRANEDKNLFIVDDTYDKDNDILAYEKSLTKGLELYNNEFTDVKEKINMVSQLLNLEVFCDSQGHIRVRSPQYNRMPSSVFYKMMHLKDTLGIRVFPKFLDNLFETKLDTLRTRIEILEDQIRLDCAILDYNTDEDAIGFIGSQGAGSGSGSVFSFISDDGGTITEFKNLIEAANPDSKKNSASPIAVNTFNKIEIEARSTKDALTNSQKYSAINNELDAQFISSDHGIVKTPQFLTDNTGRVNELINRIYTKSGQRVDKKDYLIKFSEEYVEVQPPLGASIDIFKIVGELSDKLREHQKVLKIFYNTIKNAREFKYLDEKKNTGNSLITAPVRGTDIPEVFEHMIEDETYDDYGPGSGTRYVIKRSQIKSISISENPPPATHIEVHGLFDPLLPNISAEGFNAISNGNGLISAVAVDYDTWRNYGFKNQAAISAPFLTDPATQCGPYAAMLLSRNRKDILKGTVTITGNEYMQCGEVIYLEDRGLLFYVTSVSHSFTFGSTFQTTLQLTYGHTPGEYIPTVMDMIGKLLYNNKDVAEMVVERQDTSSNDINIGALHLITESNKDGSSKNSGIESSLGNGDSAKKPPTPSQAANSQIINNIVYTTKYQLTNNANKGNKVTAKIELRTYYDSKGKTKEVNSAVLEFAKQIRELLTGGNNGGLQTVVTSKGIEPPTIAKSDIKDVTETTVDLSNINDRRTPSQKAIDLARNLYANKRGPKTGSDKPLLSGDSALFKSEAVSPEDKEKANKANEANLIKTAQDGIRNALFENIVDCWISITTEGG